MTSAPVIVSGASGLIGKALVDSLRSDGLRVIALVRRPARTEDEIEWLSGDKPFDPEVLRGAQAVVNLNGASIGRLPWTRSYRRTLAFSRLIPTKTLAQAVRALGSDAPAFVSASAVGFYGDRPGELLTETSSAGTTFLARLCVQWEHQALTAGPEARVTLLRTAPLLHPASVLRPMIRLTRLGLSGPLGGGRQIWPWISLDDHIRALRHIIDKGIVGAVNLSGPEPASANDIGRALARAMRRPYMLPAPAWALRCGLSRDAADSLLLSDATVRPETLLKSGFEFQHTTAAAVIAAVMA